MEDERLDEHVRLTRLRKQGEERRRRKIAADLRLQQKERQAEEAQMTEAAATDEQRYAELPRHSHTGIR